MPRFLFCAVLSLLTKLIVGKEIVLNGAGASFPSIVYRDWNMLYASSRSRFANVTATFQRVGSGAGLKLLEGNGSSKGDSNLVYAASDADMKPEEHKRYPELVMFPALAGAVVFIYNLPGIDSLVLNRSAIAAIFLGTIRVWNDKVLRELNPGLSLPAAPIQRTFRDDVSGTTEMLTSALSSFSADWDRLYGVSSRPPWPMGPEEGGGMLVGSAASMGGYVSLTPYSFGYLSLSDAETFQPSYAIVMNKAGNRLQGAENIVIGVQEAMEYYHANQNSSELIQPIIDAPTPKAYPLAAYTYLIINISTAPSVACEQMIEFVRYASWFINNTYAHQVAQMNSMVPLSPSVSEAVVERVLKRVTCKGVNVYDAMMRQIDDENRPPGVPKYELSTTMIVLIAFLALVCLLCPAILFAYFRRRLLKQAINKKEWLIDSSQFRIAEDSRDTSSGYLTDSLTPTYHSENGVFTTAAWTDKLGLAMLYHCGQHHADAQFSQETLRFIVRCRKQVEHVNVARWLGVTAVNKALYQVYSITDRRTLHQALVGSPYKLNDEIKLSIASAVASGVEYLHQHGIVHGNLSTWTCLLDSSWTVKVACWAENHMLETERLLRPVVNVSYDSLAKYPTDALMRMAFVHPDLLVNNRQSPKALTKLTPNFDAYSFGVMLIEIGTRAPLWMSKAAIQGWAKCVFDHCRGGDMISEMFANDGRDRMPVEMTQIASQLLRTDGSSQSFSSISRSLKRSVKGKGKSIVDILLSVVEEHANTLEDAVKQKTAEVNSLTTEMDRLLSQALPQAIATQLRKGESVEPEHFDSCTVLFANIISFTELANELMPYQVVKVLNALYAEFDSVLGRQDVYKVETIGDTFLIVSGVPNRNTDLHAREIALTALSMLESVRNFVIDYMPRRKLVLRLGMATGPVIAGVVGSKMPRYCLFGDTVKMAAKMEFTSLPNCIQVTGKTADFLRPFEPEFFVQKRTKKDKDHGITPTYWLVSLPGQKQDSETDEL